MKNIQWKVIRHLEGRDNRYIKLEVDESLEPLRSFFFEVPESNYPSIIESFIQGVGYGSNGTGVIFPNDLD